MPPPPSKLSVSLVTPCYNEEDNIELLWQRIRDVMAGLPEYDYEHIVIDNCSSDATPAILRRLATTDPRLKVIFNARNFGHIRSPVYGLMQATGDAVMLLASDLQDPPELIPQFLAKWRDGFKIVVGVKNESQESPLFFFVRKCYYNLIARLSEVPQVKNFTGFGLYDQQVIAILRQIQDPYPYFRGLICDLGFARAEIPFFQPVRTRGFTKNNFYTLYDIAMLGITNHSKVPLRLASFTGFCLAGLSLLAAAGYLVYKLLFWNQFQLGRRPPGDRPLLLQFRPVDFPGHCRRICRCHPHPGAETTTSGGEGADQFPAFRAMNHSSADSDMFEYDVDYPPCRM